MYEQVDADENYTFMMNCMFDYKCNKYALTIKYQKNVVKVEPSIQQYFVGCFI